jgi:hypothetical protein
VEPVEEFGAVDTERLGGSVEVKPVAGFVLDLGGKDGLAAK